MRIGDWGIGSRDLKVVKTGAIALGTAALAAGCNVQVSMPTAEAASQAMTEGASLDEVGGLEPGSQIQNQLMHSYTHDSMTDFIITNSGHQRRGF